MKDSFKENTKYSVLLPVYAKDNPEWLRIAIDSMVNQTLPPDEIVIAVDGPVTDELAFVIKEYEANEDLFNICWFEENEGLGATLRKTVPLCRNEYIARMDADDYSIPVRCEIQMKYLNEHKDVGVCGSYISEFIDDMDNIVAIRKVPSNHDEIVKFSKRRCPTNHPTLICKKTDIIDAGNYNSEINGPSDYEIIVRMIQNGTKIHNINKPLLNFRANENMYKRRGGIAQLKMIYKVQRSFYASGFHSTRFIFYLRFLPYVFSCFAPNWMRKLIYMKLLRSKASIE